jgi:hypothetical protein
VHFAFSYVSLVWMSWIGYPNIINSMIFGAIPAAVWGFWGTVDDIWMLIIVDKLSLHVFHVHQDDTRVKTLIELLQYSRGFLTFCGKLKWKPTWWRDSLCEYYIHEYNLLECENLCIKISNLLVREITYIVWYELQMCIKEDDLFSTWWANYVKELFYF